MALLAVAATTIGCTQQQKWNHEEKKALRDAERATTTDVARLETLTRESQFQKAELARLKRWWREEIERIGDELENYQNEIEALRAERKCRSEELQSWLFEQFEMLNARGEKRNLCEIFASTPRAPRYLSSSERANPITSRCIIHLKIR